MVDQIVIANLAELPDLLAVLDAQNSTRQLPAVVRQALQCESDIAQRLTCLNAAMREMADEDKVNAVDRYFERISGDLKAMVALTAQTANAAVANSDLAVKLKGQRDQLARELTATVNAVQSVDKSHPLVVGLLESLEEGADDYQTRLEDILGDDEAAETLADLVLGRAEIAPEQLSAAIGSLLRLWEQKTGRQVIVQVVEQEAEGQL